MENPTDLAVINGDSLIGPVMDLETAKIRLQQFQEFVRGYLVENEDFGIIPGTPKPTLLKPGADKLCELYGLADDYVVTEKVEDYDRGLFDYTVKCILIAKRNGQMVASGLGSCNSWEKRYRWRDSQRLCPNCGKPTIIKGREEYGGGWVCFAKKGGCGAKFADSDQAITGQTVGRIQNEDIADVKNTVLKMAKKRAKVDATLSATRSSGVFTQDIEDMPGFGAPAKEAAPPTEAPEDLGSIRVKWLNLISPMDTKQFLSEVGNKMMREGSAEFVRCADSNLLSLVFNRLPDADVFSAVLCPLMKTAYETRKEFVNFVAAEAKRRGYVVNRTTGLYEEKSK